MGRKKNLNKKLHKFLSEQIGMDNPELDMEAKHAFVVVGLWEHEDEDGDDSVCVMSHNVNPDVRQGGTKADHIRRGGMVALVTSVLHGMMPDTVNMIIKKGAPIVAMSELVTSMGLCEEKD